MNTKTLFNTAMKEKRYLHVVYEDRLYDGSAEDLLFNYTLFHTVRIASYVAGYSYPIKMLKKFKKAYLILGTEEGIGKDPMIDLELVREEVESSELKEMVQKGQLEIRFIGSGEVLHSKIYLMEGEGLVRVGIGSANFSEKAFKGKQYEELFVSDKKELYEIFRNRFDELWQISVPVLVGSKNKEKKKQLVIELVKKEENEEENAEKLNIPSNSNSQEIIDTLLERVKQDYSHLVLKLGFMPPIDYIENLRSRVQEKRERLQRELEQVIVQEDIVKSLKPQERGSIDIRKNSKEHLIRAVDNVLYENKGSEILPGRPFYVWKDGVLYSRKADGLLIPLFVEDFDKERINQRLEKLEYLLRFYIEVSKNKKRGFEQAQRGFEVLIYAFSAPFLWKIRERVKDLKGVENIARIPVFLIVGGHADSGKTKLLTFVSQALGVPLNTYKEVKTRGQTKLEALFAESNVAPIFLDEIEAVMLKSEASEGVIKNISNTRLGPHPCLIGATNALREQGLKPEIIKRIYYISFSNPMPKDRDFIKFSIEYYNRYIGEEGIDNYLFKVFATLFAREISESLTEERLTELISDPLKLSRETWIKLYHLAERNLPDFFPHKGFYDDIYSAEIWQSIYKLYKHAFIDYEKDGNFYFVVKLEEIEKNPLKHEFLISKLPNYIIHNSFGQLILHKKEFLEFIGEKDTSLWLKTVKAFKNLFS